MYGMFCLVPEKAEEDIGSPGTGMTGSWSLHVDAGTLTQTLLLTVEPSLQPTFYHELPPNLLSLVFIFVFETESHCAVLA